MAATSLEITTCIVNVKHVKGSVPFDIGDFDFFLS